MSYFILLFLCFCGLIFFKLKNKFCFVLRLVVHTVQCYEVVIMLCMKWPVDCWILTICISVLQNLNQNKRTLLPKFYGLYCIQAGGKNIRIVVMNNLLPRSVSMHLKFDLKGSTYKRRASPKERMKSVPTFKDLDFMQDLHEGLLLETDIYSAVCRTISRDCLVRDKA